jgi:hypothetical protein
MKTLKRFFLPNLAGIISFIVPSVLGYKIDSWQYWWIALPIILSWTICPLFKQITNKKTHGKSKVN